MRGARWSSDPEREGGSTFLCGAVLLGLLLFGIPLAAATARANEAGSGEQVVLAALSALQPLPAGEMARQTARGVEDGNQVGAHITVSVPTVRLWDDFGAFSPPSISSTIVTISSGMGQ
jgi:hypothetical protein